jgi:hypothetical protein
MVVMVMVMVMMIVMMMVMMILMILMMMMMMIMMIMMMMMMINMKRNMLNVMIWIESVKWRKRVNSRKKFRVLLNVLAALTVFAVGVGVQAED